MSSTTNTVESAGGFWRMPGSVITRICEDWGETSPVAQLWGCLRKNLDVRATHMLTTTMVHQLCPVSPIPELGQMMFYLASDRIGAFEAVFAFYDGSGELLEVDPSEVVRYVRTDDRAVLHNPNTGERLSEADVVFVYFRATALGILELSAAQERSH